MPNDAPITPELAIKFIAIGMLALLVGLECVKLSTSQKGNLDILASINDLIKDGIKIKHD